ncbi:MAG: hypothetical protein J6Z03_08390 [Erysipelotrichaceae bacterium]|nr:hypothetical protein [Erysipelotrichaceae bacterium]
MLKKIVILEILILVIMGGFTYSLYNTYQESLSRNSLSSQRLEEVRKKQEETAKQIEDLNEELVTLRESIDTEVLDIWKRRVQQLKEELE